MHDGRVAQQARFERAIETSDGVKFVWLDHGPAEGRAVVLCHGLAAGADQFDADARALAAQGFRVLAPDLRGHGRSGRPDPDRPENYAIARMAQDIVEMLDAAGAERVDYVGNSLGGILALHLLENHPHRFRTLTTFGTATALNLPGFTPGFIPLSYRLTGKRLTGWITALATTSNRQARPLIEKLIAGFDPRVGQAVALAVCRYDLTGHAERFPGPYMMIRGQKDRQVNAALKAFIPRLAALSNFTLVEMEGAGHCVNLDRPEAFRQVLMDFWARHPG